MYCTNCGAKNQSNARFCCDCGAPLSTAIPSVNPTTTEVQSDITVNKNTAIAATTKRADAQAVAVTGFKIIADHQYSSSEAINEDGHVGLGYVIFTYFIPLVGFILWFMWRNSNKLKGKTILFWAWLGVVFNLLMYWQFLRV